MANRKRAFITGIAGQDGYYLTEFLLSKNYEVHGLIRWDSSTDPHAPRLEKFKDVIKLHFGDVTDAGNITRLLSDIKPDEIYNLAGLSHVKISFDTPCSVLDINLKGAVHILEAIRTLKVPTKFYQASSSELFGDGSPSYNEGSNMQPCSIYGISKLGAYHAVKNYRNAYNIFACNGILFNHESPMRGHDFVTQKIIQAAIDFENGRSEPLYLGNINARRDWGHARDYVAGMWMMMQHDEADDFVLASEENYSVREFTDRVFKDIGMPLTWSGEGKNESSKFGDMTITKIDPDLYRPTDINELLGDASKAQEILGWRGVTTIDVLITEMLNAERERRG